MVEVCFVGFRLRRVEGMREKKSGKEKWKKKWKRKVQTYVFEHMEAVRKGRFRHALSTPTPISS